MVQKDREIVIIENRFIANLKRDVKEFVFNSFLNISYDLLIDIFKNKKIINPDKIELLHLKILNYDSSTIPTSRKYTAHLLNVQFNDCFNEDIIQYTKFITLCIWLLLFLRKYECEINKKLELSDIKTGASILNMLIEDNYVPNLVFSYKNTNLSHELLEKLLNTRLSVKEYITKIMKFSSFFKKNVINNEILENFSTINRCYSLLSSFVPGHNNKTMFKNICEIIFKPNIKHYIKSIVYGFCYDFYIFPAYNLLTLSMIDFNEKIDMVKTIDDIKFLKKRKIDDL